MLLLILFILGVSVLFYLYQTRNRDYWKKRGVVLASGHHWLFGHSMPFLMGQKHLGQVLHDVYNEFPEAPYVGYMNFSTPGLVVRDPDLVRAVLSTDFNNFAENQLRADKETDFLMGHNPFVLQGQEWRTVRGHATPIITLAKLKSYWPTMRAVCDELVHYVKNKCDHNGLVEFETKKLAGMYTTDVIANAILGVGNNTFRDEKSAFARLTGEILKSSAIDNLRVFMAFTFPGLAPYFGLRFSPKRMEGALLSLTKQKMIEYSNPDIIGNDLFQQMKIVRDNDPSGAISDKYIAGMCFTFVLDGYETSSNLICFTLFELAWHSDVQDKLRNEIMDMIAETNNEYTVDTVEQLPYLEMVLSESLRIHPLLSELSKICSIDYKVPGHPLTIKKGTQVNICAFALHFDEKHFPNPHKFDPERFTDEETAKRHKFAYLPFGEGPRKCLGQRLALLQVKLAIVKLVQNFRLTPSVKTNYPVAVDLAAFISKPLNGAWIHFSSLN